MFKRIVTFLFLAVLVPLVFAGWANAQYANISVDGNTADWTNIPAVVDIMSDGSGTADNDWTKGLVANDGTRLYLRGDVAGSINTTSEAGYSYIVYIDVDNNASTGFNNGWWGIGAEYKVYIDGWNNATTGGGWLLEYIGSGGSDDSWAWSGHPTAAAVRIKDAEKGGILEMAVNLADIKVDAGNAIGLLWRANLNVSPWGDDSIPEWTQKTVYAITPCNLINIDGDFSDWDAAGKKVEFLGSDVIDDGYDIYINPARGQLGTFADMQSAWAAKDVDYLYMKLNLWGDVDVNKGEYAVYCDVDNNTLTGYEINNGRLGADYFFSNGNLYQYAGGGTDWVWNSIPGAEYAVSSAVKGGLSFDGEDDWIDFDHLQKPILGSVFTITCWVKIDEFQEGEFYKDAGFPIINRWWNSTGYQNAGWSVEQISDGRVRLRCCNRYYQDDVIDIDGLETNEWYHLAFVFDADNDVIKTYKDGVSAVQKNEQVWPVANTNAPLYVGARICPMIPNPGYYFKGSIRDIEIYTRTLSPEEINSNKNGNIVTGNLVFHNDYTLGHANDLSGNGYKGAIHGGAVFVPKQGNQMEISIDRQAISWPTDDRLIRLLVMTTDKKGASWEDNINDYFPAWDSYCGYPYEATFMPVVTDDGAYTAATKQLHAAWSASYPESGIAEYQYAIGTSKGAVDVAAWTSVGTNTAVTKTGLALVSGKTYYFSVKAKDGAEVWSSVGYSDGIKVDTTLPTTPVITDDGAYTAVTTQLHAVWSASDPESGIAEYQYAIGTSKGAVDVAAWTSVGTNTAVTKTGLALVSGKTYYFSVKAKNGVGVWSSVGYSDGIKVDTTLPTTPSVMFLKPGLGVVVASYTSDKTTLIISMVSSDPESYIVELQYAIGSSKGATDARNWTTVLPIQLNPKKSAIAATGLNLTQGKYYSSVKAKNGAGLWSNIGYSGGITVDTTPPTTPVVTDGGATTTSKTQLRVGWSGCSDPESNLAAGQYAIGTTAGWTDVKGWTQFMPPSPSNPFTIGGLSLTIGKTYYISLKFQNGVELWSNPGCSDGIKVVQP